MKVITRVEITEFPNATYCNMEEQIPAKEVPSYLNPEAIYRTIRIDSKDFGTPHGTIALGYHPAVADTVGVLFDCIEGLENYIEQKESCIKKLQKALKETHEVHRKALDRLGEYKAPTLKQRIRYLFTCKLPDSL